MSHIEFAIMVFKVLTLVLGGLITFLAWKAYRRTDEQSLRALTWGFAVITLGSLLAGVVHLLSPMGLLAGVLLQSILTAVGFAVIVYSLYVE